MTFTITGKTDRDDLEDQVTGAVDRDAVRASDSRAARLQRNIRRQSRNWGTDVSLSPQHQTAHVEARPDDDPQVVITARELPQPETDYDARAWDWLAQRGFGIHEVGHIRYTDFDDWDARMSQLDAGDKGVAHSLHNALEDGAIERQITKRWSNYDSVLKALRANVLAESDPGIPDPEQGGQVFPVAHAIQSAILDLWARDVYGLNIGTLDTLTDGTDDEYHFATSDDRDLFMNEALPRTKQAIPQVLTEAHAPSRNALVMDYIEDILDLLDDADADGKSQQNGQSGEGDDGNGMPDDSRDNHSGEATSEATELGEPSGDDDADAEDGDGQDAEGSVEARIAPAGDDDAGGSADIDLDDIDDIEVDPDVAQQAMSEASDDAREEMGMTDDLLDELEEMADAVQQAGGDDLRSDELELPTDDVTAHAGWWEEGTTQSERLAQLLRQRLQSERRTETKTAQKRGRFTGRGGANVRARRGDRDVFERRNEPDDKDYSCLVVLDRSSSMNREHPPRKQGAVISTVMLLDALEKVGVDTMLVELYASTARLAKPFGTAVSANRDRIGHSDVSGGTPLTDALLIARARLNQKGGQRFGIVVTDGEPARGGDFSDALQGCTFPVIGVNVTGGSREGVDGLDAYERAMVADPNADLQSALYNLLQEVMF